MQTNPYVLSRALFYTLVKFYITSLGHSWVMGAFCPFLFLYLWRFKGQNKNFDDIFHFGKWKEPSSSWKRRKFSPDWTHQLLKMQLPLGPFKQWIVLIEWRRKKAFIFNGANTIASRWWWYLFNKWRICLWAKWSKRAKKTTLNTKQMVHKLQLLFFHSIIKYMLKLLTERRIFQECKRYKKSLVSKGVTKQVRDSLLN